MAFRVAGRRAFSSFSSSTGPFSSTTTFTTSSSFLKPSYSCFHTSLLLKTSKQQYNNTSLTSLFRLAPITSNRTFSSPSHPSSTTSPNIQDTASTVAIEDAQSIVEREHFAKVRSRLEGDKRKKVSYKEYETICAEQGLTKGQAKQLAQSLSDSGIILHFGNSANASLRDFVYLKPAEFNRTVSRILAQLSDDTYLKTQTATKQAELAQLRKELQPLQEQRTALEQKAHRTATTYIWLGFGYCVVQGALVARLTWWELSWDVMEPVTYMLTFATVLIGYSYFVLTGSEYTFEGLRKTFEKRKLAKLLKRKQFDEATYNKLQEAVLLRQDEVKRLLEEIEHDPVSLHLKNPERPIV